MYIHVVRIPFLLILAGTSEVAYFLAYLTTDTATNPTTIILFDGIEYNNGNHYSAATGTFIAPVDGWYRIEASLDDSDRKRIWILVNAASPVNILYAKENNHGEQVAYGLVGKVIYLTAGQDVYVKPEGGLTMYGNKKTWFSVTLVHAD